MIFHLLLMAIASPILAQRQFSFRQLAHRLIENPATPHASGEAFATESIATSLGAIVPTIESILNSVDIPSGYIEEYNRGLSNEDAKLSAEELLIKYGHQVEVHTVETDDGYVLTINRIPSHGSTVFLMHGLFSSSDDFVTSGPESGLAYLLARAGYDVWMGNARGNKHSRLHRTLNASQREYWDFSWHEIGVYDLPAMIDYVLDVTGRKKLKYVGHSQGTTSFFVMASERPEYNEKIEVMVALSPVIYMSHLKSPLLRLLAPSSPVATRALNVIGPNEFVTGNLGKKLGKVHCRRPIPEVFCFNTIFLISGYDLPQLNATNIPVYFAHMPSGVSTKQVVHYAQEVTSGEFQMFDYGTRLNERVYGSKEPHKYDLGRVTAPVALFYAEADWLSDPIDVARAARELPNVVDIYQVPYDTFTHLDFIIAKDLKTLIFDRLIIVLNKF